MYLLLLIEIRIKKNTTTWLKYKGCFISKISNSDDNRNYVSLRSEVFLFSGPGKYCKKEIEKENKTIKKILSML